LLRATLGTRGIRGATLFVPRAVVSQRSYAIIDKINPNPKDLTHEQVKKLADEGTKYLQQVKEQFSTVDRKEIIDDASATYLRDYTKLYNELQALPAFRDPYPSSFYEQSPVVQTALKEFQAPHLQLMSKLVSKYGFEVEPGLQRYRSALDYISGSEIENVEPIRVAVTGASGQIGYALCFRIASGALFGPKIPVILQLLEIPAALETLKGLEMEIRDCAFPTLHGIITTDSPEDAFAGVDYACLVGAQPRSEGMERKDLLMKNAEIFSIQGKALNKTSKKENTRVYVVGNPANTNALIAQQNANSIPPENFVAMTRLDHNRGLAQIAAKTNVAVTDISRFVIWGNHSSTQFPDVSHALIKDSLAVDVINDYKWIDNVFIPTVQQRGSAIIKARGKSSAASAAAALIEGVYDWHFGTAAQWTSAAVHSSGEYGVTKGLFYSYPVVFSEKRWGIVRNLPIDEAAAIRMEASHKELLQERDGVSQYLPS